MKYLQIQVDVQAVQMKTVVMETRHLDVDVDEDEVDVYVLLFEKKKYISSWKPTRISYSMLLLQGPFMSCT